MPYRPLLAAAAATAPALPADTPSSATAATTPAAAAAAPPAEASTASASPAERPSTSTAPAAPRRHADRLPGPRGLPWLGHALQLRGGQVHRRLEAWSARHGDLYRLRVGPQRIVVVADHRLVAAVLRDRPDGFRRSARLEAVGREMGLKPGLFMANGESWQRQRRLVMAAFDPAHVRRYHPALQRVAGNLFERWRAAADAGRAIDLQADLMRYTVDTIAGLAFGAPVDTLGSDGDVIQQHLDQIFPALFRRVLQPVPWWRLWSTAADRRLGVAVAEVTRAVDAFVAAARCRIDADPALRAQPTNLLEAMISAADMPDSGIDDAVVAGNVLTMLLAGEDTTANTLAWMTHLLWRNPQALQRAVAEVREVCGDAVAPTFEQMGRLAWVEACAHETMRLKPVAPILPLQALREVVVGDVVVPAGHVVIGLMRRDAVSEAHLPNAAAFDPARWLDGADRALKAASPRRVSMPFGAGPRICPGRYLALLEIKMAMAVLLGRFDLVAVDVDGGAEPAERLAFTMAPVGLRMRLRVRR